MSWQQAKLLRQQLYVAEHPRQPVLDPDEHLARLKSIFGLEAR